MVWATTGCGAASTTGPNSADDCNTFGRLCFQPSQQSTNTFPKHLQNHPRSFDINCHCSACTAGGVPLANTRVGRRAWRSVLSKGPGTIPHTPKNKAGICRTSSHIKSNDQNLHLPLVCVGEPLVHSVGFRRSPSHFDFQEPDGAAIEPPRQRRRDGTRRENADSSSYLPTTIQ